jgi:hypothetical protein
LGFLKRAETLPGKAAASVWQKNDPLAEENASTDNGRPLVANGQADVGHNASNKKKLSRKSFENYRFLTGRSLTTPIDRRLAT